MRTTQASPPLRYLDVYSRAFPYSCQEMPSLLQSQMRCQPPGDLMRSELFETRKNQNQLLIQEDALISCCRASTYLHPQILPCLNIQLQLVKTRSTALIVTFSEQMCHVAGTTGQLQVLWKRRSQKYRCYLSDISSFSFLKQKR